MTFPLWSFTGKACHQQSQVNETYRDDLEFMEKDQIREDLNSLDLHKSMQPDDSAFFY